MKNVMTRAWEIAKAAVKVFGGSAREYIAEALRQAWAESRRPRKVTLELRQPNRKQKTWVAQIVGTHDIYKLDRKFISSDSWGSTVWTLGNGVYDVCENGNRYYIRVANGEYSQIEAHEVA